MGIHDRPYMTSEWQDSGGGHGPGLGLPRPGRAIRYLLIINLGVFFLQILFDQRTPEHQYGIISAYFGVTVGGFWQPWRYVTFQFLHSTHNLFHIGLNMLGLYMLGTPLERSWGSKPFLRFYLICGAVAGLAYVVVGALRGLPPDLPIVGASGGVYGVVLACAVLFPQFRIIMIFFLVPIRLAASIIFGAMILMILMSLRSETLSPRFWSDVAHLGGAAAAAVWVWVIPRLRGARAQMRVKMNKGAWERKMRQRAEQQREIDRILRKIHDQGLDSLTRKEKQFLRSATRQQQQEEQNIYRN